MTDDSVQQLAAELTEKALHGDGSVADELRRDLFGVNSIEEMRALPEPIAPLRSRLKGKIATAMELADDADDFFDTALAIARTSLRIAEENLADTKHHHANFEDEVNRWSTYVAKLELATKETVLPEGAE